MGIECCRQLTTFFIRLSMLTCSPPNTDEVLGFLWTVQLLILQGKGRQSVVNSPISIPLALSSSRLPSDLVKIQAIAADALKIERYINSKMETDFIWEFEFAALAADLSINQARVHSLLSKLAGHETAIVVCNPQKRPKTPATERVTVDASGRSGADVLAFVVRSSIAPEAIV
jgi:hypothetical protein